MKYDFDIKEITKEIAKSFIEIWHYSKTLPRLNKKFLGFYLEDELVGVMTFGGGTRPRHTIQKIYKGFDTKDYYEIGRMAMTDDMPKNSESQMISKAVKGLRENTEIKVLFTWADGMFGKVGYVYQAANFDYIGNILTEMYVDKYNNKIHIRSLARKFSNENTKFGRPTKEQLKEFELRHVKGLQFRYIYLIDRKLKKNIYKEILEKYNLPNPKDNILIGKERNIKTQKGDFIPNPKLLKIKTSKDFNLV